MPPLLRVLAIARLYPSFSPSSLFLSLPRSLPIFLAFNFVLMSSHDHFSRWRVHPQACRYLHPPTHAPYTHHWQLAHTTCAPTRARYAYQLAPLHAPAHAPYTSSPAIHVPTHSLYMRQLAHGTCAVCTPARPSYSTYSESHFVIAVASPGCRRFGLDSNFGHVAAFGLGPGVTLSDHKFE